MFNLFRSKGKGAKYLLGGLFFLLALSMLMYLVPNYNSTTDQTGIGAVLLQVGERKLTTVDAQTQFSQAYQGKLPEGMSATFFPQWLDQTKRGYAVIEAARRLGITTSNEEIAEFLSRLPLFSAFFENGKLINREGFEAAVAQIPGGYTVDRVFREIRDQMNTGKLQDAISEASVVTPKEIEDAYKRKYELASIDYVYFMEDDLLPKIKPTDAELKTRYEATKAAYNQPAKYAYRAVVLSQAAVESRITVTEQEARAYYTSRLEDFRSDEKVHARHILKITKDKSGDEKTKLRKEIDDLLKQLKGGADFAQLAQKHSDDNPSNSGDVGTNGRGAWAKPFEDAAFALKPNEYSGVVESEFGYHIIQVLEKTPSKVTPFETVRAAIETDLRNQKIATSMESSATALQAEIKKTPANAPAAAQKAGAEVITVTEAAPGTAIPTLGVSPEIDKVLPVLTAGGVSDIIQLPGDRAVIVILDKLIPARPSTFEEAREVIYNTMRNDTARKLIDERSKKAAERLRAGDDIRAVAKDLETTVKSASSFAPSDSLPDIGPAAPLEEAFRKGTGAVIGPVLMQGRYVIAKVVSKTDANMDGFTAEKPAILKTLRQERATQNNALWQDSILQKLTDEGAIKVNQTELQRLVSQLQ